MSYHANIGVSESSDDISFLTIHSGKISDLSIHFICSSKSRYETTAHVASVFIAALNFFQFNNFAVLASVIQSISTHLSYKETLLATSSEKSNHSLLHASNHPTYSYHVLST
ncbi:hypothetical protein IKN40_03850 [bacterium]|nr:hypothetical protein [bacterium]